MSPASCTAFHAGIVTQRFAETCEFYCQHFGFTPAEINPEFALLVRADGSRLGVLQAGGEGQPATLRQPTRGAGVWVRFDSDDLDILHARLAAEDVEIVADPEFTLGGERRCVARDPNGVLIYIHERQVGGLSPQLHTLSLQSTTHPQHQDRHHES